VLNAVLTTSFEQKKGVRCIWRAISLIIERGINLNHLSIARSRKEERARNKHSLLPKKENGTVSYPNNLPIMGISQEDIDNCKSLTKN
jgi:hypothetical protein